MMTYLQIHRRPGRRRATVLVIILMGCGIAVLALRFFTPQIIPGLFMSFARPFWRAELAVELGALKSPADLLYENEYLKRRLSDAQVRLATIASVETMNQQLLTILGRASTTPYTLAAVLMRPPVAAYDELVIDLGLQNGLVVGDSVYAPGNVPIGRISAVFSETSKVTLFSSPGNVNEVLIGPAHVPASAIGRGGGQYEADVPRNIPVAKGDFVIAPSLDDNLLGIVMSVITDPAQPFGKVLFAPPVNMYNIRWVLVGAKNKI